MARHPTALNQAVIVPSINQTGLVSAITDSSCTVKMDGEGDAKEFDRTQVYRLRWSDRHLRQSSFLCRLKAWKDFRGRRHFRMQVHHIYKGRVGSRIILWEKVDGRIVRDR